MGVLSGFVHDLLPLILTEEDHVALDMELSYSDITAALTCMKKVGPQSQTASRRRPFEWCGEDFYYPSGAQRVRGSHKTAQKNQQDGVAPYTPPPTPATVILDPDVDVAIGSVRSGGVHLTRPDAGTGTKLPPHITGGLEERDSG
ncbi:hypothetical protein NDU88_006132 [Pleurodeles waltl]|uniref:Uncharacterized protein n=1 Tax=Pleurodeles waltl TaxID=8319 RepID=A0AAV7TXE4_PLEWA|nr:hypothetical protein NDU88_006132 [Pleurodeles waltl]